MAGTCCEIIFSIKNNISKKILSKPDSIFLCQFVAKTDRLKNKYFIFTNK